MSAVLDGAQFQARPSILSQLPKSTQVGLQLALYLAVVLYWAQSALLGGCQSYLYLCQFSTAFPDLAGALLVGGVSLFSMAYVGAKIPALSPDYLVGSLWLILLFYYSMDTFFDRSILNLVFMVFFAVMAMRFWQGAKSTRRWGVVVGALALVWHGIDASVHTTTWITGVAPAASVIANSRENSVTDLFLLLLLLATLLVTAMVKGSETPNGQAN